MPRGWGEWFLFAVAALVVLAGMALVGVMVVGVLTLAGLIAT